jgi:predicted amidophosphoribosyltransferase
MDASGRLTKAVLDALAVLLPIDCAGCGAPDRALCDYCAAALVAIGPPTRTELDSPGLRHRPLPLWYSTAYEGVARDVLHALKEEGRTAAARPLGRTLRAALGCAVSEFTARLPPVARIELLAVPSSHRSYRTRGYNPVETILRWSGPQPGRATGIRYLRAPADQATLGVDERWENLSGSLRGVPRRLAGRQLLLVDDVATTGATLFECRRAAEESGAVVWGAITLAYTRKVKGTYREFSDDLPSPRVYGGGKGAETNRPGPGRRVLD